MSLTMDEKIKRINELYHLSQERPLTDEEKAEQDSLRRDYIISIRKNLSSQLESIKVKEPDGTIHKLSRKN